MKKLESKQLENVQGGFSCFTHGAISAVTLGLAFLSQAHADAFAECLYGVHY